AMPMSCPRISVLAILALVAACADHSGEVPALRPTGTPNFETRIEISSGTGTHADYHVADFNGDNFLDMAVVGLTGEMRIMFGNGTDFVIGQEMQIDGLPIWITGGDFDEDGDTDLVVVRSVGSTADIWQND